MKGDEKRMTSARCVYLMSVAMANDLDEVWLSGHPELFYLYLFQYFPTITRRYVVNDIQYMFVDPIFQSLWFLSGFPWKRVAANREATEPRPLCFLPFSDLRILITSLVSSNSSCQTFSRRTSLYFLLSIITWMALSKCRLIFPYDFNHICAL